MSPLLNRALRLHAGGDSSVGNRTAPSGRMARRGTAAVVLLFMLSSCRDERLVTAPFRGRGFDSAGLRPGAPSLTITGANV